MLNEILYGFWFFLPAGIANVAPIIAAKLPLLEKWDTPMDFGRSYKDKRLLGSHKTWRGIASGVVLGSLVFGLQQLFGSGLGSFDAYLHEVGYFDEPWLLGALLGSGALLGDAAKSFFKRFRGISEGETWFPFDQLDYIIGGCLFAALVVILPFMVYVWIFVVWFAMHLLSSLIGYKLGFKDSPI